MGRVQLVTWREARRLERTQAAFSSGTLVGVQATADGRLALVDPGPPVFSRDSVAYKSDGTQVASGQPRFETVDGRTGVLVEEGTHNLLSANQSSVETDLSGIRVNPVYASEVTITRDTAVAWHGTASVRVACSTANNFRGIQIGPLSLTNRVTYTFSAYIRGAVGGENVRLAVSKNGPWAASSPAITLSASFQRVTWTWTCDETRSDYYFEIAQHGNSVPTTFYYDGGQVEQKPYATAWHLGGTTRAAETLTVPTAGVVNLNEGTWEQWVYIPASIGAPDFARVFQVLGQSGNGICLWWRTSNNWQLRTHADDNTYTDVTIPNTLSVGWHLFTVTWKQTEAKLFIDGVLKGTITSPKMPSAFAASAYVGVASVGTNHLNAAHGPIRISRRARTDQEIAAAYAAGPGGMVVDEDTTYLLPGDSLAYGRGGYRVAPAIDLTHVGTAWASRVSWTAQGDGAQVLTSLDGGQSWTAATNGGPVPGIIRGLDVTGKVLTVKQRLVAQDMAAAPVMTMSDAVVMAEPQRGADVGRVRLVGSGAGRVRIL